MCFALLKEPVPCFTIFIAHVLSPNIGTFFCEHPSFSSNSLAHSTRSCSTQSIPLRQQIQNKKSCLIQTQPLLHYGFFFFSFGCSTQDASAALIKYILFGFSTSLCVPMNIICNSIGFLHIFFSYLVLFSKKLD